jgi:hypothetical protein
MEKGSDVEPVESVVSFLKLPFPYPTMTPTLSV